MKENLVKVGKISVDCEKNDPIDINCGGPSYLGFDFNVRIEELEELKSFIIEEIKNAGLPLMSMYSTNTGNYIEKEKVWTKKRISECIKKGY